MVTRDGHKRDGSGKDRRRPEDRRLLRYRFVTAGSLRFGRPCRFVLPFGAGRVASGSVGTSFGPSRAFVAASNADASLISVGSLH
jgi:hypothetical protein